MPRSAGIVLAGGRSSRMGAPKAGLEWHGSTLLRRTAGILARVTDGPVLVVRAAGQELPELPPSVEVVEDPREGKGPLQGIAAGLTAVGERADVAFICSTDLPFLHPAFVRRMLRVVGGQDDPGDPSRCPDGRPAPDVGLPLARGYPQPLAAAYRTTLAALASRLVGQDRLRPAYLFEECEVRRLDDTALLADPALAAFDPELDSVLNVNEPADYWAARDRPAPEITIEQFGALAAGMPERRGPRAVRAATVGQAAAAAGIALDGHVVAALNGDQLTRDEQFPLARGDVVLFHSADEGS
jgi:molybdenum cofactor guanylyltransferase